MNAYVYTRLPSFIRWAEGVEESFWIWQTSTFTLVNASAVGWFILFILPRHPAPQSLAGRDSKRADKKWRSTKSFVRLTWFSLLPEIEKSSFSHSSNFHMKIRPPIDRIDYQKPYRISLSLFLCLSISVSIPLCSPINESKGKKKIRRGEGEYIRE